uniref:Ig-like domain-containing protein n=1 Tax=Oncorhynchus mykiss TaxID=8022 RepID=A0A8C7LWD8_ONCMY
THGRKYEMLLEAQVSVEPQVTGYLGNDVTLRCKLLQGNLIQAEWQWEISDTEKFTIAVFSPNLGQNISESPLKGRLEFAGASTGDSSITIKDVEMTDAGKYICLLTVFPSGSIARTTILTVLSKSGSSALILSSDSTLTRGKHTTHLEKTRKMQTSSQLRMSPTLQWQWETSIL